MNGKMYIEHAQLDARAISAALVAMAGNDGLPFGWCELLNMLAAQATECDELLKKALECVGDGSAGRSGNPQ